MKRTKTIEYFDLLEEIDKIDKVVRKFREEGSGQWSSFSAISWREDEEGRLKNLKVNWSACGSQTPDTAIQFAEELKQVAQMCKDFKFVGYKIVYTRLGKKG